MSEQPTAPPKCPRCDTPMESWAEEVTDNDWWWQCPSCGERTDPEGS